MFKQSIFASLAVLAVILLAIPSCKTVDIDPVVTISLDSTTNGRMSEDNGVAYLRATLNGVSTKEVRIAVAFSGTATLGVDFTVTADELVIPAGETAGTIKISALQDNEVEGDETIGIQLSNIRNAVLANESSFTITISDDDVDTDSDGINDGQDDCPLIPGPIENNGCPIGFNIIFNEVLYDPSNVSLEGDANGDGMYDQTQDEFAEIYNNTRLPQDIGGYSIWDSVIATRASTSRFTFPAGTRLLPGKACLVFGGGTPTGTFGGSQVFVTGSAGLSMQNAGETLNLKAPNGRLLQVFNSDAYADNPNKSYTRSPDIIGDYVPHTDANPNLLFSAGTKLDGSSF